MPVDARVYPVALILKDRRCLVVGGGQVAEHKATGLLACEAEVHVVAKEVLPPIRALARTASLASIEERPYEHGEVAGYRLVVAATGDAQVNKAIYEDAEAAGVWANSADDPASCSFILPAVARQGPIAGRDIDVRLQPGPGVVAEGSRGRAHGPGGGRARRTTGRRPCPAEAGGQEHRRRRLAAQPGLGHARLDPLRSSS